MLLRNNKRKRETCSSAAKRWGKFPPPAETAGNGSLFAAVKRLLSERNKNVKDTIFCGRNGNKAEKIQYFVFPLLTRGAVRGIIWRVRKKRPFRPAVMKGRVQRGNASDFSPRKAKKKVKSVFDGALPRQKLAKPSNARPRADQSGLMPLR